MNVIQIDTGNKNDWSVGILVNQIRNYTDDEILRLQNEAYSFLKNNAKNFTGGSFICIGDHAGMYPCFMVSEAMKIGQKRKQRHWLVGRNSTHWYITNIK